MKIYLAAVESYKKEVEKQNPLYILESFYTAKEWFGRYAKTRKGYLLDSGAFTFMNNCKADINFDKYTIEYAEYINKYELDNFFELDIDSVVGLKEVERLRKILEDRTKKQCIPVWHKSRGYNYFLDLIKSYKRIAIGGIVTKEIPRNKYSIFLKLINDAHKYGCSIHGLGFTNIKLLDIYKFDSVDSTSWKGNRFGQIYHFKNNSISTITIPKNKRFKSNQQIQSHNLQEWIKYQYYLDIR